MDLTYTVPACSKEFIAVNPLNDDINKYKNYKSCYEQIVKTHEHHFCGVHNQINLYPIDFNIEIMYHNSDIFESKSKFVTLFQVIDHGLVQSKNTNFKHNMQHGNKLQQILIITTSFRIELYFVTVNKLRVIHLNIYSPDKILIYNGPIIDEYFKRKFYSLMKLSSFQCLILMFNNATTITTGLIRYTAVKMLRRPLSLKIRQNEQRSQNLSTIISQGQYRYLCVLKVCFTF